MKDLITKIKLRKQNYEQKKQQCLNFFILRITIFHAANSKNIPLGTNAQHIYDKTNNNNKRRFGT